MNQQVITDLITAIAAIEEALKKLRAEIAVTPTPREGMANVTSGIGVGGAVQPPGRAEPTPPRDDRAMPGGGGGDAGGLERTGVGGWGKRG